MSIDRASASSAARIERVARWSLDRTVPVGPGNLGRLVEQGEVVMEHEDRR